MAENNKKKKFTKKQKEVLATSIMTIGFGLIAAGAVGWSHYRFAHGEACPDSSEDIPVVDVDDVLKFIVETTGVDMETARKVDEAELNYWRYVHRHDAHVHRGRLGD